MLEIGFKSNSSCALRHGDITCTQYINEWLERHQVHFEHYFQTCVSYYEVLSGCVTILLGFSPVLCYLTTFMSTCGQYLLQLISMPNNSLFQNDHYNVDREIPLSLQCSVIIFSMTFMQEKYCLVCCQLLDL